MEERKKREEHGERENMKITEKRKKLRENMENEKTCMGKRIKRRACIARIAQHYCGWTRSRESPGIHVILSDAVAIMLRVFALTVSRCG